MIDMSSTEESCAEIILNVAVSLQKIELGFCIIV